LIEDLNLIQGVGAAIEEALILYAIKEWYRINRNADDFQVEE
jgi:hypothetical protein